MSKKFTVWLYCQPGGDGDTDPKFFATREKAEEYEEAYEDSDYYEGGGTSPRRVELEFDEDGVLVNHNPVFETYD